MRPGTSAHLAICLLLATAALAARQAPDLGTWLRSDAEEEGRAVPARCPRPQAAPDGMRGAWGPFLCYCMGSSHALEPVLEPTQPPCAAWIS